MKWKIFVKIQNFIHKNKHSFIHKKKHSRLKNITKIKGGVGYYNERQDKEHRTKETNKTKRRSSTNRKSKNGSGNKTRRINMQIISRKLIYWRLI